MKLLDAARIILYPLSPVYSWVMTVRNKLFDAGVFRQQKVDAKVISVGNLTVGGTGKTPLVIYITKLLKQSGYNPGVLSRGYGRKGSGYLLVSDGNSIRAGVQETGDEIYQTSIECKVPAAVSESRVPGAKKLIEDTGVQTIVLDDAFQHRWIARDADILIIEQRFLRSRNRLRRSVLPTGMLRESFSGAQRADIIVLNRKFSTPKAIPVQYAKYFAGIPMFTARYRGSGFVDVKTNEVFPVEEFIGQKSLVISGIANPVSFFSALKLMNIDTSNKMIFKDHFDYNEEEIQRIRRAFYNANTHSVITTQKDAVKLKAFEESLDDIDIYYLKIEMVFDDPDGFKKEVLKRIH